MRLVHAHTCGAVSSERQPRRVDAHLAVLRPASRRHYAEAFASEVRRSSSCRPNLDSCAQQQTGRNGIIVHTPARGWIRPGCIAGQGPRRGVRQATVATSLRVDHVHQPSCSRASSRSPMHRSTPPSGSSLCSCMLCDRTRDLVSDRPCLGRIGSLGSDDTHPRYIPLE